jgi:hypothetical protein
VNKKGGASKTGDVLLAFVMKKKKHFDMGMFMWYRDMTKSGNRQF